MKTMHMERVKELHRSLWNRADWFGPQEMKLFGTRLESTGFITDSGDIYFVTSEKGPSMPRRFNVRKMDGKTGEISTVGPFNLHTNYNAAAASALSAMAGEAERI